MRPAESVASRRLLLDDAFTAGSDAASAAQAGHPVVVDTPVTELHGVELGVWQMWPGTAEDEEIDEIFLVLAGSGRVTFSDGSILVLRAGVLVRLVAGERTTWVIDEPLRKLYVAWPTQPGPSGSSGDLR